MSIDQFSEPVYFGRWLHGRHGAYPGDKITANDLSETSEEFPVILLFLRSTLSDLPILSVVQIDNSVNRVIYFYSIEESGLKIRSSYLLRSELCSLEAEGKFSIEVGEDLYLGGEPIGEVVEIAILSSKIATYKERELFYVGLCEHVIQSGMSYSPDRSRVNRYSPFFVSELGRRFALKENGIYHISSVTSGDEAWLNLTVDRSSLDLNELNDFLSAVQGYKIRLLKVDSFELKSAKVLVYITAHWISLNFPDLQITSVMIGENSIRCRTHWEGRTDIPSDEKWLYKKSKREGLLDPDEIVIGVLNPKSPIVQEVRDWFPDAKLRFEKGSYARVF